MGKEYGRTVELGAPFEETLRLVRDALASQGFGVLSEIDVRATLKAKLDADIEPYLILGACNPHLAHRALEADRSVGMLLPCNVVVRGNPNGGSIVQVLDPEAMVELSGLPELRPVADEARQKLDAALASLG